MATHSPSFLKLVNEAKSRINECTVADVVRWKKEGTKFHFVDCREDSEWQAGRAQGAIHLGKGVIERDIEGKIPDKKSQVVIYCGGGFRSALAAEALQRMGYENVISMDGGIRAWREAGLPEDK